MGSISFIMYSTSTIWMPHLKTANLCCPAVSVTCITCAYRIQVYNVTDMNGAT